MMTDVRLNFEYLDRFADSENVADMLSVIETMLEDTQNSLECLAGMSLSCKSGAVDSVSLNGMMRMLAHGVKVTGDKVRYCAQVAGRMKEATA